MLLCLKCFPREVWFGLPYDRSKSLPGWVRPTIPTFWCRLLGLPCQVTKWWCILNEMRSDDRQSVWLLQGTWLELSAAYDSCFWVFVIVCRAPGDRQLIHLCDLSVTRAVGGPTHFIFAQADTPCFLSWIFLCPTCAWNNGFLACQPQLVTLVSIANNIQVLSAKF